MIGVWQEVPEDRPDEMVFHVGFQEGIAVSNEMYRKHPEDVKAHVHRLMVRRFDSELRKDLGLD